MEGIEVIPTSSISYYNFEIAPNGLLESLNLEDIVFYCEVVLDDKIISKNELFFVEPKNLKLNKTDYELSCKKKWGRLFNKDQG